MKKPIASRSARSSSSSDHAGTPASGGGWAAPVPVANSPIWFDLSGGAYVPRYGVRGVTLTEDTTAKTFTFAQSFGASVEKTVFNSFAVAEISGGSF